MSIFKYDNSSAFRYISCVMDIPVICYGLRTDWQSNLFPASNILFELADSIEEIKTTCWFCNKKATQNFKMPSNELNESINEEKEGEQKFVPACYTCFTERNLQKEENV